VSLSNAASRELPRVAAPAETSTVTRKTDPSAAPSGWLMRVGVRIVLVVAGRTDGVAG
jgi:hypothetical protein